MDPSISTFRRSVASSFVGMVSSASSLHHLLNRKNVCTSSSDCSQTSDVSSDASAGAESCR